MEFPRPRPLSASVALAYLNLPSTTVLGQVSFRAENQTVHLTGSLADGFANRHSDVDLIVVGGQPPSPSRSWYGGHWIDIWHLSETELEGIVERVRLSAAYPQRWGEYVLEYEQIEQAHRLGIALPFGPFVRELVPQALVRRAACFSHMFSARNLRVDLIGAIESRQWDQAMHIRRMIIEAMLDAACALAGETNPNPKWRLGKQARCDLSGYDRLCDLKSYDALGGEDAHRAAAVQLSEVLLRLMSKTRDGTEMSLTSLPPQPTHRFYEIHGDQLLLVGADGTAELFAELGCSDHE